MDREILKQALKNNNQLPSSVLADQVWVVISVRIERRYQVTSWMYRSLSVLSVIACIPALKLVYTEVVSSGFLDYVSLVFSPQTFLTSSKEFLLVVAETVPVFPIALFLGLCFVTFRSLHILARQKKHQLSVI